MRSYKAWFGAQQDFDVSDKYRHKKRLHWGKPSIWLSNYSPYESGVLDHEWWDANVITIKLEHKIVTS